jgi:hypothetical protein
LSGSNIIRVVASALVLSTLSFAAGVAGDLSLADPPNYGTRVVVRIPPAIPSDAPRAAPLISTSAAEAAPVAAHRIAVRVERARPAVTRLALVKPRRDVMAEGPKPDPDRAPKTEEA